MTRRERRQLHSLTYQMTRLILDEPATEPNTELIQLLRLYHRA